MKTKIKQPLCTVWVVSFKLAYGQRILRYLSKVNENIGSQRVLSMNVYISFIHSNSNGNNRLSFNRRETICASIQAMDCYLINKKYMIDTHNNMKDSS